MIKCRHLLPIVFALLSIPSISVAQTAIVKKANGQILVEVSLGSETTSVGNPTGGLFLFPKDSNPTLIAAVPSNVGTNKNFTLQLPAGIQYDSSATYKVILFVSVKKATGEPDILPQTIDVQQQLELQLLRGKKTCAEGLTLRIAVHLPEGQRYNWQPIFTYFDSFASEQPELATIKIKKETDTKFAEYPLRNFSYKKAPVSLSNEILVCLNMRDDLPSEKFTAQVTINPRGLPLELGQTATQSGLPGTILTAFPKAEGLKQPDDRKIEQNLNLGMTFTSSVADVDIPATKTTPAIHTRARTNRGVLDVRFAPWINVLHPLINDNKWATFFTPLIINANVATGKIVKDTLAMNRILIGFEGESRYKWAKKVKGKTADDDQTIYPVWHRVIWGITHASDRDFKQDEVTAKLEYAPIFPTLYKPIELNYNVVGDRKIFKPFGYAFKPKSGVEIGRTYHRSNPAKVIPLSSNAVRRLYFGGELSFDITEHLNLSIVDTYYLRFESEQDRYKNYFKGQVSAPIARTRTTAHSLFLVFERGNLPPFNTPSVNAVRVGYRVTGDFCSFNCR